MRQLWTSCLRACVLACLRACLRVWRVGGAWVHACVHGYVVRALVLCGLLAARRGPPVTTTTTPPPHTPPRYIAGFLAFRECALLLELLDEVVRGAEQLPSEQQPQVILVDGNGKLHHRGFGLACQLGVLSGIPTVGVGSIAPAGLWL